MSNKLGFYDLMNIAEQNAEHSAKVAKKQKFASFECPKPKKLDPKQKKLSDNIQKFLAKKQEEERRIKEEEKRKKEKLEALRSQDKKATKRVGQMLRMTKSANKSVLAEAKNSLEDQLVEQDGYQPDEDDYGYVSQHAAEYHKKMLEKYRALPTNKPAPAKTSKGVPIPQPQSMKESKVSDGSQVTASTSAISDSSRKQKPKPQGPAPINFDALMKIAEVNTKEPLEPLMLKPTPKPHKEDKFEFGRPMTKKEKEEYLREKEALARIARGILSVPSQAPKAPIKIAPHAKPSSAVVPQSSNSIKNNTSNSTPKPGSSSKSSNNFSIPKTPQPSVSSSAAPKLNNSTNGLKKSSVVPAPQRRPSHETHAAPPPIPSQSNKVPKPADRVITNPVNRVQPAKRPHDSTPQSSQERIQPPKEKNHKPKPTSSSFSRNDRVPTLKQRPNSPPPPFIPKHLREKELHRVVTKPPKPLRESHRMEESDFRNPHKAKGRQIVDSSDEDEEEEYDSEMDDFIDDSELGGTTISDMIRNITGYDKNRYKDMSDDECMESNVWEQMREEQRSLRIGIKEDLEDIRREEEENKLKAALKKKKKKLR